MFVCLFARKKGQLLQKIKLKNETSTPGQFILSTALLGEFLCTLNHEVVLKSLRDDFAKITL